MNIEYLKHAINQKIGAKRYPQLFYWQSSIFNSGSPRLGSYQFSIVYNAQNIL